jgi:alpha-1,2-mannosyltransferase
VPSREAPDSVQAGRNAELHKWRWPRALGALGLFALVATAAVGRAEKQRIGTDFHVFWQAGHDFAHGLPLYEPLEGARRFIYPPFAAQAFQFLAVFPLKPAAGLFYAANVILIFVAVWLTRDIVRRLGEERQQGLPLILAIVLSGQFVLNNLNLLQMNLVIFVLCLLSARGIVLGRAWATGWVVIATLIKITPIFFVVWAVVRGGWRPLRTALVVGLGGLVLLFAQRGPSLAIADLTAYYNSFLQQFAAGGVVTLYTNQTIGAMVYRAVTIPKTPHPFEYHYLASLQPSAPVIYRTLAVIVFSVFLLHLFRLAKARRPFTSFEIASVFLVGHLLSGVTWKAHLVTLLFVFYSLLALDHRALRRGARLGLGAAWLGMAVIGLAGRDLVGSTIHHYVGGYSVFVWVMLLLLILCIALSSGVPPRPSQRRSVSGFQPMTG